MAFTGSIGSTDEMVGRGYRPESVMRFSVRCDRGRAAAIERAAKKAGMSATAFVQAHFETILDEAEPPVAEPGAPKMAAADIARGPGRNHPDDRERASDLGLSMSALRLLRVVSLIASNDGTFVSDPEFLGQSTNTVAGGIHQMMRQLEVIGAVERVTKAVGSRKAIWRLLKPEASR